MFVDQVGLVERSLQLQAARHAEDDMASSLFATSSSSVAANADKGVKKDSSISIDRIKFISMLDQKDTRLAERMTELQTYLRAALAKAEKIKALGGDKAVEAETILRELSAKHVLAEQYLSVVLKGKICEIRDKAKAAQTSEEMVDARAELIALWKLLNTDAVGDFVSYTKKFNQSSSAMGRTAGARKKEEKPEAQRSPLFVSLMESITPESVNCSTSVFEAKGGLRPALLTIGSSDDFDKLVALPILKKAMKHVKDAVDKGTSACTQALEAGKPALKKFEETLVKACGTEVRTKCALPKSPWAESIFNFEIVGGDSTSANVTFTPYGMMCCCLLLSGDASFLGIPYEQVDGATFKEKRASVLRYTVDNMTSKLEPAVGGWFVRAKNGSTENGESLIVIPSGFILATAGVNVRYLRWVLVADSCDTARVKSALRNMLLSFPELHTPATAHQQFAEHLGIS